MKGSRNMGPSTSVRSKRRKTRTRASEAPNGKLAGRSRSRKNSKWVKVGCAWGGSGEVVSRVRPARRCSKALRLDHKKEDRRGDGKCQSSNQQKQRGGEDIAAKRSPTSPHFRESGARGPADRGKRNRQPVAKKEDATRSVLKGYHRGERPTP